MPKRNKIDTQEAVATAVPGGFQIDPDQTEEARSDSVQTELKQPSIAEIFGPGGALEKCMPEGYEHRPSQLEMAELVESAFRNKRHAIVEAGTGTGKSLAYLVPSIARAVRHLPYGTPLEWK